MPLEKITEVGGVFKAKFKSDFLYRLICIIQESFGFDKNPFLNNLKRRLMII